MDSADIGRLKELRAHHQREIERIDNAVSLLQEITKMSRKADGHIEKVRRRIGGANGVRQVKASKNGHGGTTPYQRQLLRKQKGIRPVDIVRQMFVKANGKELSVEQLRAAFQKSGTATGEYSGPDWQINRILGLALRRLRLLNEIKETRSGFVAKRLQQNGETSSPE